MAARALLTETGMITGEVITGDVKTRCTVKWSNCEEKLVL